MDNEPADAEAQFQLGLLHYRERQFEASRDAFQQCLRYDEGFYELSCRYRLGLSHYYTGACTLGWSLLRDSLDLGAGGGGQRHSRQHLAGPGRHRERPQVRGRGRGAGDHSALTGAGHSFSLLAFSHPGRRP